MDAKWVARSTIRLNQSSQGNQAEIQHFVNHPIEDPPGLT